MQEQIEKSPLPNPSIDELINSVNIPNPVKLPIRNFDFVKRNLGNQSYFKLINASFETEQLTVLTGLGGNGKTQLVLEYAHQSTHYNGRLWFAAETREQLNNSYEGFYHILLASKAIKNIPDLIISKKIDTVKAWLEKNSDWLIVYDNAENFDSLKEFIPGGGKILITSRYQNWPGTTIDVGVLAKEEATKFIKKLIKKENADIKNINQLAELLGYLPLALAQASAYIKKERISIEAYIKQYGQEHEKLLNLNKLPVESYRDPVAVTWNITLKLIEEKLPAALQLIKICSYLDAEAIPITLLEHILNRMGKMNYTIKDSILLLEEYSMLKTEPNLETVSIHRVVQQVIRNQQNNNEKLKNLDLFLKDEILYKYIKEKDYIIKKSFIIHWKLIIQYTEQIRKEEQLSKLAQNYWDLGWLYRQVGNPEQAIPYYNKSLNIYETNNSLCDKYPLTDVYNGLAICYFDNGQIEKSLENYQKIIKLIKEYDNKTLSQEYKKNGKETNEELEQGKIDDIAYYQYNLGRCYFALGSFEKAKEIILNLLAINQSKPFYFTTLANCHSKLGQIYSESIPNSEKKALENFSKAFNLRKNQIVAQRENHEYCAYEEIAYIKNEEGFVYRYTNISRSIELYKEALSWIIIHFFQSEKEIIQPFMNFSENLNRIKLADFFLENYKNSQQENLSKFFEELNIKAFSNLTEKILQFSHRQLIVIISNVGDAFLKKNAFSNAEFFLMQAKKMADDLGINQHPKSIINLARLVECHLKNNTIERAKNIIENSLNNFGQGTDIVFNEAKIYEQIGLLYKKFSKNIDGTENLRISYFLERDENLPNSPPFLECDENLPNFPSFITAELFHEPTVNRCPLISNSDTRPCNNSLSYSLIFLLPSTILLVVFLMVVYLIYRRKISAQEPVERLRQHPAIQQYLTDPLTPPPVKTRFAHRPLASVLSATLLNTPVLAKLTSPQLLISNITQQQVNLGKKLGQGSSGIVMQGNWQGKELVAVMKNNYTR